MSPHYGFEFERGGEVEADAPTLADAITEVEASSGRTVLRGRCLDGFDNDAPAGTPAYIVHHLGRPRIPIPEAAE